MRQVFRVTSFEFTDIVRLFLYFFVSNFSRTKKVCLIPEILLEDVKRSQKGEKVVKKSWSFLFDMSLD